MNGAAKKTNAKRLAINHGESNDGTGRQFLAKQFQNKDNKPNKS
jgi:hypothetical protein